MPVYDFKNKETGQVITRTMKIAEREQFLNDNPHLEPYFDSVPSLVDPVRIGVRKTDNGFKEVLQKIHSKTPGSRLNKTAGI